MTRARELADLLTGGQTISTADNTEQIIFKSTDADASAGPLVKMHRESGSPADGDALGRFNFIGENDADEEVTYARIHAKANDVSDGTEDGELLLLTTVAGTNRSRMAVGPSETVFNEDSVDVDFRVESNGNANMLFVDAGNDLVGINTDTPASLLEIKASALNRANGIALRGSGANDILYMYPSADNLATIEHLIDGSTTTGGNISINPQGGNVVIGKTDTGTDDEGCVLGPANLQSFTRNGQKVLRVRRNTDDGTIVEFFQAGNQEGTISVSGSTVSYNGGHLARFSQTTDGNRIDGLVKGTVMTNLDQMAVWHHEAQAATYYTADDELPDGVSVGDEKTPAVAAYDEDNEQLNCMAVSSVEGDANVAGVFVNWDDDDDEFTADMNVAMTGDMVIRIAGGTTVARGDLLMSAGDGTAKPQGDDIVRSKTIAKVTSTTKSHTYDDGTYLVPCVLMAC